VAFFISYHKMIFMRMAFLIMAHKNPSQIERLVRQLDHEDFDIYLHLDKKANLAAFEYLAENGRVKFIANRIRVTWGGISIPDSVIASMKEIMSGDIQYDFISLISGQDYPLRSAGEIYSYFEKRRGKNFLYLESLISPWWSEANKRINRYDMVNYSFPGKYRLQWLVNFLMPRKMFPFPFVLYGGPRAAWFTLTPDCAKYVIDFLHQNPQVRKFFYHTWGADEFVFPTVIMNSKFKRTVVIDNDFLYMDWTAGGCSPKILTCEDANSLRKSSCYMARKFDVDKDLDVFDLMDKAIEKHASVIRFPASQKQVIPIKNPLRAKGF